MTAPMNRLKLWVFVALVLAVGFGDVYLLSRRLTGRAVAQIDRELRAAATQVDARVQLLGAEASRLADALSRDPALAQALAPEGGGDAGAAAQTALKAAAAHAGGDATKGLLVVTSGRSGRTLRVNGADVPLDAALEAVLPPAEGGRREAPIAVGDAVFYAVGVGGVRGASVAVGVPLGTAWLQAVRSATGSEVTIISEGRPPHSTLAVADAAAVAAAARDAVGQAVNVGRLAPQRLAFDLPLPPMPLPFTEAPAHRVQAVALTGLAGGLIALSQSPAPLLAPVVSYAWTALAALALLALVGLVLGLLVTNEQRMVVPADLVSAADRLRRGDFTARAPVMAGSLGTLAEAMNTAAEAAQALPGLSAASVPAKHSDDPFAARAAADSGPFEEPGREPPAEPLEPAPAAGSPLPFESAALAPEPAPEAVVAAATPWQDAPPPPAEESLLAPPPAVPVPLPPPPAVPPDEEHWRAVFADFVRVRAECGEPGDGVAYDRFRQKLQKNHDLLMQKYACRTVRFQVYVKDGKAALKASPVR
jgi:hypothetical protein